MSISATQFALLTYNIHKGFGIGNLRFLLPEMRHALRDILPDIICLQEVQGRHDKQSKRQDAWPDCPQSDYIAEKIWPYVVYGKNAVYQVGHHGNAVLSRYPILTHHNLNVSTNPKASRSLLHTTIEFNAQRIHLLCVHLGLFQQERCEQIEKLEIQLLNEIPIDEPLILAGDFNDWRRDITENMEARFGLKEAIKESTGQFARSFPAFGPVLHVDRIYYRGLKLSEAYCLSGKPWRMLSDHLPLYARFEL